LKGKSVKEVPVRVDPEPAFFVNARTARRIGIEIPFTVLQATKGIELIGGAGIKTEG
jgi:putative ABC transport system substrate-binding protein